MKTCPDQMAQACLELKSPAPTCGTGELLQGMLPGQIVSI